jgi:hypothetical protein
MAWFQNSWFRFFHAAAKVSAVRPPCSGEPAPCQHLRAGPISVQAEVAKISQTLITNGLGGKSGFSALDLRAGRGRPLWAWPEKD